VILQICYNFIIINGTFNTDNITQYCDGDRQMINTILLYGFNNSDLQATDDK